MSLNYKKNNGIKVIAGRWSIVMWAKDRKLLSPLEWPKLKEGRERRKVRKTELFVFLIPHAGGYPRTMIWLLP